jgi:hypothetical protein
MTMGASGTTPKILSNTRRAPARNPENARKKDRKALPFPSFFFHF